MKEKGMLFVISAPSGSGKTTLCNKLLQQIDGIKRSISMTTRGPRLGERDGRDYIFITREEFLKRRSKGEFLESSKVFGEYYGTPKNSAERYIKRGTDVLLSIDVQGAMKIKRLDYRSVFIFIAPPSLEELKKRLALRSTEHIEKLKIRLSVAKEELKYIQYYDYIVVNDNLNEALSKLKSIIMAERCRIELVGQCPMFQWKSC